MECLAIVLSCISVCIGFSSLVFSVIYLIKVFALQATVKAFELTKNDFEEMVDIFIYASPMFTDGGMIPGKEAVEAIMSEFNCNKIQALKILHSYKDRKNKNESWAWKTIRNDTHWATLMSQK